VAAFLLEVAAPSTRVIHPQGPFDVFLSYARLDNNPVDPKLGWVTALHELIQSHARLPGATPPRVFFDTTNIRDYEDWRHKILAALRHSKLLLVCLSPSYFASKNCRWEWEHFLRRQGPHERGEGETIQSVRFIELPTSIDEQNRNWLESVRRSNTIDLQPWFAQGPVALQRDPQARAAAQRLVDALLQRIKLARRELARQYGNLRAANEHFVGRRKQLRDLHEMVGVGTLGVITAVHGLGGIGKTELALHYANDYARSFPGGIWWINAANQRDLRTCLASLIDDPRFPQPPERSTDDEDRYAWALHALREAARQRREQDPDGGGQVLILLDNVDHPALLGANQRVHVANSPWLSLLATTRESAAAWSNADRLAVLPLDALDPEDALALIREWQPNHAFASTDEEAAAEELCGLLGGFTLAVEQAAIHLGTQAGTTVRGFLGALKAGGPQRLDELARNPELQANMQHREKQLDLVLAQTLPEAGSLERVLLNYAACWGPDAVPKPWIDELVREHHPELVQSTGLGGDPLAEAWTWLVRRRLLTITPLPELLRMHRLVRLHARAVGTESVHRVAAQIDTQIEALASQKYPQPTPAWKVQALQVWATFDPPTCGRLHAVTLGVISSYAKLAWGLSVAAPLASASLEIFESRFVANSQSNQARRDLFTILDTVGDIKAVQGGAATALATYQRSLNLRQALAEADPRDKQAQLEVADGLNRIGSVKIALGDVAGAQLAYEQGRVIAEALVKTNSKTVNAARTLSISLLGIGEIKAVQREITSARALYQQNLQIREQIAQADPSNTQAQHDLAVALDKIGDIKVAYHDFSGALADYQRSLDITEMLAQSDPTGIQTRRDVATGLVNVGDMKSKLGDESGALASYLRSLGIREAVAEADPGDTLAIRDVAVALERAGMSKARLGEVEGALAHLLRNLELRVALTKLDPSNYRAHRDLAFSHGNLWQIAVERDVARHHASQVDRLFAIVEGGGAYISAADRARWADVQQWLRNNP
jgi:tetratricopeptide (TPR) repeat protein